MVKNNVGTTHDMNFEEEEENVEELLQILDRELFSEELKIFFQRRRKNRNFLQK